MAVVLNFHGLGSNALTQEAYSGLVPVSDREGFLLVGPEGTGNPRAFYAGLLGGIEPVNDVAFTADLLNAIASEFCIDPARVYATGLSNGGFMSSALGCRLSDRIAAIAPVGGVFFPGGCGRPVPILAFHGTADRVVPFEGGSVLGLLTYGGVPEAMAGWARHAGCAAEASQTPLGVSVVARDYAGCTGGVRVGLVVHAGGHTWPGAVPVPSLGETTSEVSASEMLWEFFRSFTVAGPR